MEKSIGVKEHAISMVNRASMSLTGVSDVSEFSDTRVDLKTSMGGLCVRGKNLTINRLDTDNGTLDINGDIQLIQYTHKGKDSLLAGFFK